MMFASSLYIALLFIVTGRNVLGDYVEMSIFVAVCLILTTSYSVFFVIIFHFHDEIGNFLERSFGVSRSVQRKSLRFMGYLFAGVLVVFLIVLEFIYTSNIRQNPDPFFLSY